jgi:hypothetical protein
VQYNLTPKLSIENLEVPKSPASTEEMLYFLRHFSDEGLPIGLVMDIAHHWHNYADLFRYLHSVHLADQELYLDLLSMHLSLLHTHFPEVLIAYHITQSYIDRESNIHVTHGLPGSLEGKPVNFNGLVTNPDSRLEWLSTHDVLQVLKDVAGKHTLPLTRVVLEVHHRAANELLPVAQAMMELWSK